MAYIPESVFEKFGALDEANAEIDVLKNRIEVLEAELATVKSQVDAQVEPTEK